MASIRIMVVTMAYPTGQGPAHRGPTLAAAAQILGTGDKVTRVVIMNSLVRVTSSNSQDIRVIQSS